MKFKVGDKVKFVRDFVIYEPGDVVEVVADNVGSGKLVIVKGKNGNDMVLSEWIELVEPRKTKNQRIKELEKVQMLQNGDIRELITNYQKSDKRIVELEKAIAEQIQLNNDQIKVNDSIVRKLQEAYEKIKSLEFVLAEKSKLTAPKNMRETINEVLSEPPSEIKFEGEYYRKVDREAREGDVVTQNVEHSAWMEKGRFYKMVSDEEVLLGKAKAKLYTGWKGRTPETVDVYELIQQEEVEGPPYYPFGYGPVEKSPNQQRAEIIEKAKKFVEENGGDDYHFEVDEEKRTVFSWKIVRKGEGYDAQCGLATCSPNDVYNEFIGRTIALGRALGLDVSEFEQAVQPTEFVVGQKVFYKSKHGEFFSGVRTVSGFNTGGKPLSKEKAGYMAKEKTTIINDTNAIYEMEGK